MTTDASTEPAPHGTRRDFLYVAAGAVSVVGAGAAIWPLIDQLNPDAAVLALASVDFDLASLEEGQVVTIKWRGQPIFVRHRTPEDIKAMQAVPLSELKDPAPDSDRVKKGHEQYLVMIGICTHLGCIPLAHQGNYDGFFCPCHGSQYDTSGRIRQGPAPLNLAVPPYAFLTDTKIRIG